MSYDRTVWVAADSASGAIGVALSRKEAVLMLREHRAACRSAVMMARLAGRPGKMPPAGKIVRLTLPGAGYNGLYP